MDFVEIIKQAKDGLTVIAEALRLVEKNDERFYEAELYRLKGELLLMKARQQATGNGGRATGKRHRSLIPVARCPDSGSPKGLIRRTSKKQRRFWKNLVIESLSHYIVVSALSDGTLSSKTRRL